MLKLPISDVLAYVVIILQCVMLCYILENDHNISQQVRNWKF
jgi:uncharacterized membrane protein